MESPFGWSGRTAARLVRRYNGNISRTSARPSPAEWMRPSNCASSTAVRMVENSGPGWYPAAIRSAPVTRRGGLQMFVRELLQLVPRQFVVLQAAVARQAIQAMQFQVLLEIRQAQEALQRALAHVRHDL